MVRAEDLQDSTSDGRNSETSGDSVNEDSSYDSNSDCDSSVGGDSEEDSGEEEKGDEDEAAAAAKKERVQADIDEMRRMMADMDTIKARLQNRLSTEKQARAEGLAREDREREVQSALLRKEADEKAGRLVEVAIQTEPVVSQQQINMSQQHGGSPHLGDSAATIANAEAVPAVGGDTGFADAILNKAMPAGLSLYDLVKAPGFGMSLKVPSPIRHVDSPEKSSVSSSSEPDHASLFRRQQQLSSNQQDRSANLGWSGSYSRLVLNEDSVIGHDGGDNSVCGDFNTSWQDTHPNSPVRTLAQSKGEQFALSPRNYDENAPSVSNSLVSSDNGDDSFSSVAELVVVELAVFCEFRSTGATMAEFVEMILAQLIGNISTALILVLIYFNFLLFENYLRLIVWAILCSQALRQAKNNVVSVLEYLSDDADVERYGFLTCVFSKSTGIFISHPHDGSRRTAKEIFLNYGIFLFSLIGAVSIWMRMYSWMSFLNIIIGFWIAALSLIKILDRRIFYYRYFFSDEVLVSVLLILGFFITGAFVILFLGSESYLEGSRAATDLSDWVQVNFINDERTRQVWSEQVENSRAMISQAVSGVEDKYNDTMWWPPLKSLVKTYYVDAKSSDGNVTSHTSLFSRLRLPENMTLVQAVSFAYSKVDSVNLTSVQLTDWTSKGLEVSSIAVGSVAQLVFLVFTLVIAFVSLGIRSFFFISSLFYLLCTNWDPIERFVEDLLPIQIDKRPDVVRSLRKVIEGVFFLPLKMASIHAIVTMVSFTIVNADFMYLATTVTFFISIVPIIPPYLVCVPWVISIGLTSSIIKALALFAVQYVAFTVLDEMLYEKSIVALNAYVSALSVVFGVYVFGFEGVIFGPLIVCGVTFAYDVSNHGIQAAQDEYGKADDARQDALDCSDAEGSHSTASSFDGDERVKEKVFNNRLEEEEIDQGTNIFSNAMYRVISGPLVDRVRRRLSIDIATEGSVCVTFVIEGLKHSRKVRFVVNKSWSLKTLYDNIRRMLHVHSIECIRSADGVEVLSPLHIMADEVLYVKVRSKHRLHHYSDSYTDPQTRVSFPVRTLSPSYHGLRTSITSLPGNPDKSSRTSTGSEPPRAKLKRTGSLSPVGVTHGATVAQRQVHEILQRKSGGVTIQYEGGMKRRGSYSGVSGSSVQLPAVPRSTSNSSSRVAQPAPSPLAIKNLATSTSSLAQDYEFLSTKDSYHTPVNEKAPLSEGEEGVSNADASTDASYTMDQSPPNSLKKGKLKLNLDLSDSGSFSTSPVSCEAPGSFNDRDDDNKAEEETKEATAADENEAVEAPKAKRRVSVKTRQGAKLMFSPLAVDPKKVQARSYSSSESGDEDNEQDQ
ncbi:AI-2E family transporter [Phytophthora infestans]|uniref:AI-2E family transporter n=1 Tax=Phytophthora infestans TaxID=4787 RepID=A0A8S9UBP9_PHYIN|nr:AI-2E family transporter [Phytophthora infestans]